jgi:hypothetical protein
MGGYLSRALMAIYSFSIVKVEFLYITIVMDDPTTQQSIRSTGGV